VVDVSRGGPLGDADDVIDTRSVDRRFSDNILRQRVLAEGL
jgi:hypothetical protein